MDFLKLGGKYAIVTGAAKGIGLCTANKLAEQGAIPILVDINKEGLDQAINEISLLSPSSGAYCCDLTNKSAVEKIFSEINEKYGRIDILINNAGILDNETIETISDDLWDKVIDVNLRAVFLTCREAFRYMKPNHYGKIINLCSTAMRMGGRGSGPAYGASKGGVFAMSMNIARVGIPYGINVNMVAPGPVQSDMSQEFTPEQAETLFKNIPMGRFGTPEEVANTILFLSSDVSSYMAGAVIDVNGGMEMGF